MFKLEGNNAASQKLKTTQAELEASQAELEATQAELETALTKLEATEAKLEASQLQATQLRKQLQNLKRLQGKDPSNSANPSLSNDRSRFFGWILLPMRVFLGLTFIYAGIQKLTDPQFFNPSMPGYIAIQIKGMAHGSPLHDFLIGVALPHAVLFGWMTALGEIAIGLGTYAGLLFRPAAFFGMLLSLTFFLSASWNTYPYFLGSDIVFVFCWVTMILSGPLNTGLTSLDEWLVDLLVAITNTGQKLPLILQIYIFLVMAGTPHKSSSTTGISLLRINPLTRSHSWQQSSNTQDEQMSRRAALQDWFIGAATVASITLLGIPLRIFGHDPNANLSVTTTSPTSPTSSASNPSSSNSSSTPTPISSSGSTSAPSTPSPTTSTKATPIPVRPVSIGQIIAPASAIPKNASVSFIIASSQNSAVLIHLPNGNFVAYDATCTHAGCPVAYTPDTHILVCPCHGSQFDPVQNGAVLQGPAAAPLSALGIQIDNSTGAIKLKSVPS